MCGCSKQITEDECSLLVELNNDVYKRLFIYHIFDDKGLKVAYVPKGENPNKIATKRGFIDEIGNPQWYHISEHPCIQNKFK